MDTHVNSPQMIFTFPQRLLVPLFQRPYVWSEEHQWAPLWQDVERVADKVLAADHSARHFLGAVVVQQEMNSVGTLMVRTIIDGQQRLTTLQLLFDAVHEEIHALGLETVAHRLTELVENSEHHRRDPEDRFKVWPTNKDRDAFAEVMATPQPDHATLTHKTSRIVKAHEYFARQARAWLTADAENLANRANALVDAVATRLQVVVIDLKADEDAQEIFETLNARGTPLTAADLIKNLVFQRLGAGPEASEKAYQRYWEQFETEFWEREVSSGRVLWSRSSLFLTQWLTSRTQLDIPAREVFAAFKRYLDDSADSVEEILRQIKACADVYEDLTQRSARTHGPLGFLEMFVYRSGEMQSEVVKPLLIWLTDPSLPSIPETELARAIGALESWLVRRTLSRETTKGYNRFIVDVLSLLAREPRTQVGQRLEEILREQTSDTSYWPDDDTVRATLEDMPIYRRLSRGRLRMVLEAIEDHKRGYPSTHAKAEEPVVRTTCTIEHVMPQRWGQYWPLPEGVTASERDALVHTLGNLTLVSKSLNPSMSNGPWLGEEGKRAGLEEYSTIKLNSILIKFADESADGWDEDLIQNRTMSLIEAITEIWPVPQGHRNDGRLSDGGAEITLARLVQAGLVPAGSRLVSARDDAAGVEATVLADGKIEYDGRVFETPSGAGRAALRRSVNGWAFWRLTEPTGPRLLELRSSLENGSPQTVNHGPYTAERIAHWIDEPDQDLERLVLGVTDALPKLDTVFPAQRGKGDFIVSRYWAFDHHQPNICIGVPKAPPLGVRSSPIWARYNPNTTGFRGVRDNLSTHDVDLLEDPATGQLWVPLVVRSDLDGAALIGDLVDQILEIDAVARTGQAI